MNAFAGLALVARTISVYGTIYAVRAIIKELDSLYEAFAIGSPSCVAHALGILVIVYISVRESTYELRSIE